MSPSFGVVYDGCITKKQEKKDMAIYVASYRVVSPHTSGEEVASIEVCLTFSGRDTASDVENRLKETARRLRELLNSGQEYRRSLGISTLSTTHLCLVFQPPLSIVEF
jgi:hypothetical protein